MSMIDYGGQRDPRGGGVMGTADAFERPAIREAQMAMEKLAIPKQAFLDPWRENSILLRAPSSSLTSVAGSQSKPAVAPGNRRTDIPATVSWLKHDALPSSGSLQAAAQARFALNWHGDAPAGGANVLLGSLAMVGDRQGQAGRGDKFYATLTAGFSEEEKRQFLLSNGRRRRFAAVKHAPTDTLGLGKPLPLSGFTGGFVPTGPTYRTAPANNFPKLAVEPGGPAGVRAKAPLPSQLEALGAVGMRASSRAPSTGKTGRGGNPALTPGQQRAAAEEDAYVFAAAAAAAEAQGEGPGTFDPWVSTRWGQVGGESRQTSRGQPSQPSQPASRSQAGQPQAGGGFGDEGNYGNYGGEDDGSYYGFE